MSRYIPAPVDQQVKKQHFFECAWCGINFTERHHIEEYHKGGQHTVENLILLCPNCHTQVHNNEISQLELIKRKSTHLKGDRLSGSLQFEVTETIVKLGGSTFNNVPILLMCKSENIIELKKGKNDDFFLTCRFYNIYGELIFWMSSNRYWATSDFNINFNKNELTISNNKIGNEVLKLWVENNQINLKGISYINGTIIEFSPTHFKYGNIVIKTFDASYCQVGMLIL